jgi:uncharacterized protein
VTVIDVDAHFEPTDDWLDEFPVLKAKLPDKFPNNDPRFRVNSAEMFAFFVTDDLLRGVPAQRRMAIDRLVTPAMRVLYDPDRPAGVGYDGASMHLEMQDVGRRVAWMDEQGIATQNVITGTGYSFARVIDDPLLGMETLSAINSWMADRTEVTGGRLAPVTSLRFEDLDWVIEELTRMRARGSRSFLISTEPVGDIPPNHPDYDRVWAAATDLGMVPLAHVGMSPARYHPAWANTDDPSLIRVISTLQPWQQAQVFLAGMVLGGVFERHPKLTILFSEHGIDWVSPTIRRLDGIATAGASPLLMGEYRLPLTPAEYIRRNVRISPLPAAHESPVRLLERYPELMVFSSDYPHFEGSGSPLDHYRRELVGLPPEVRESFLSGSIAECYARMGDPIAALTA